MLKVSTPDSDLKTLYRLSRFFRTEETPLTDRIEQLMVELKAFSFSPWSGWSLELLHQARHFAEEIICLYVSYFWDLSQVPVTYYKREKWIRRHFDQQFSQLFKEIVIRSGRVQKIELILEEPIYYLLQKAREKSFPRAPKSKKKRPHLNTLKIRFHADLGRALDSEGGSNQPRVLLPYEI
jgi:hypothetical protein